MVIFHSYVSPFTRGYSTLEALPNHQNNARSSEQLVWGLPSEMGHFIRGTRGNAMTVCSEELLAIPPQPATPRRAKRGIVHCCRITWHTHTRIHTHICIYNKNMYLYIALYIYMYIYTYIFIFICTLCIYICVHYIWLALLEKKHTKQALLILKCRGKPSICFSH